MKEHLAVSLVFPKRYDYARWIEQCCQKDKGDGDRKREQMRSEGKHHCRQRGDTEWCPLLMQTLQPPLHIHKDKEYGERNGGSHYAYVVIVYTEVEEVEHVQQDEQNQSVELPCCHKCGHAQIEPCHELSAASVQKHRHEEECRHQDDKQYLTCHNMYSM